MKSVNDWQSESLLIQSKKLNELKMQQVDKFEHDLFQLIMTINFCSLFSAPTYELKIRFQFFRLPALTYFSD